jgi:hypothetical protein
MTLLCQGLLRLYVDFFFAKIWKIIKADFEHISLYYKVKWDLIYRMLRPRLKCRPRAAKRLMPPKRGGFLP